MRLRRSAPIRISDALEDSYDATGRWRDERLPAVDEETPPDDGPGVVDDDVDRPGSGAVAVEPSPRRRRVPALGRGGRAARVLAAGGARRSAGHPGSSRGAAAERWYERDSRGAAPAGERPASPAASSPARGSSSRSAAAPSCALAPSPTAFARGCCAACRACARTGSARVGAAGRGVRARCALRPAHSCACG